MFEGPGGEGHRDSNSNQKKRNGPGKNSNKRLHGEKKKKKKNPIAGPGANNRANTNGNGNNMNVNSGSPNLKHSVGATTSKARPPIPPNQEKKINNKRSARKKREKLLEVSRKASDTPLSTSSESSTTRVLLNSMNLAFDAEESSSNGDGDGFVDETFDGGYVDLPTDKLILNTETVERIIEQISTDIESEVEADDKLFESDEDEDEFGETSNGTGGSQRYFLEKSGPKCFNCGQSGHILKDCPETSTVPCNLCGQIGHSRFNCPQELCYNCSRPGHQSKACPARRKRRAYDDDLCNRCGQPGHLSKECSMAWRGYVFARDLPPSYTKFSDELRGLRKRCYNCASISHFGDDCPNRRRPTYSVFHIPDFDYLDRAILRVKLVQRSRTLHLDDDSYHQPKELNAKQKQADNFKKVINSTQKKNSSNTNKPSDTNKPSNTNKQSNTNKPSSQKSIEIEANRTIFMQSRGIVNETNADMEMEIDNPVDEPLPSLKVEKKPVPFVKYQNNQIHVKEFEEESIRKGSSSHKKSSFKPSYRGGYK
jgi:hypothetical protein